VGAAVEWQHVAHRRAGSHAIAQPIAPASTIRTSGR
jgi:hypothetical protein